MAQISTNEFRVGVKVEIDGQPYVIAGNEFVKPGKGQAFNRVRLKNLLTGRVIERTLKSGEKVELADVVEAEMRLLYSEGDGAVFMDEQTFEQTKIPFEVIGDIKPWLMDDLMYAILIYKGTPVSISPPTFMEMKIVDTAPGVRGDTASGRVLKPAVLASGAEVQVPIFVNQGDIIKVDTRTGEYVSRVS